jgi:phosphoglycolate phosphatase-like HAD superfamily hydrolase
MPVAFFDVGDTLANVRISATGSIDLFVLPGAREALEELKIAGIKIGIISDPGTLDTARIESALEQAGIYGFLDRDLIVFGAKNDPLIFRTAAARAKLSPEECIFTGESARERAFALDAGFLRVSPHPTLARPALEGKALVYAAITPRSDEELEDVLPTEAMRDVVPLRVSGAAPRTIRRITR